MNKAIIVGRLTAEPELRSTQAGKTTVSFTVACNRGKDGADFIRCVAWGKTAEGICQYFGKGQTIGIVGSQRTGSYQDKDGKTVYTNDTWVDSWEFVGSKSDNATPAANAPAPTDDFVDIDSDLPWC